MKILDNDLMVKELDNQLVFEQSKPIIYSLISGIMYDFGYCKDDIIQECALNFYEFIIKKYDHTKGVIIGRYLKTCYKNCILKFLWKERRNTFDQIGDKEIFAIDFYNWKVENMEFAKLLTKEQIQILQLILEGFEYAEICKIISPNNKTKELKRPIYRRMVKIKEILSRYYALQC